MGKLYLGTDIAGLAEKLAANLDQAARAGDFFCPATIVVPNPFLRKWLRLLLARKFGIAINLRFTYLEALFGELLREVDPRSHPLPIELMEDDTYRLLILFVLLDEKADGAALGPLRDYLGRDRRRDEYRRAWQLAVRLADLIREYEYQRRDEVILPWLAGKDAYPDAPDNQLRLERAQRELFRLITREPNGLRATLGRSVGKLLKTLPQYAGEIMELAEQGKLKKIPPRTIHVFGIAQVSAFHHMVLRTLGRTYDIRIYHLNPLIGRLPTLPKTPAAARDAPRELAERFRAATPASPADELLTNFGQAGVEGLTLMADLAAEPRSFPGEIIPPLAALQSSPTALSRLQEQILGLSPSPLASTLRGEGRGEGSAIAGMSRKRRSREPLTPDPSSPKLGTQGEGGKTQDTSLQIVACPGMQREVETVYQSILHNLQRDPSLQQTDIAVLVTDLERYRPVIRAVFERQPRRISFNLADFTVAGLSAFAHGVVGLLDLALESFTRSRVFAVLLNPCFLARLGVDHEQALTWLDWASSLGIYHAWDRDDKKERGYPDSAIYSWRLGLQRLRLGRLMDVADERDAIPAPQYQEVIPFADMASADKEQLDAFCRAVEGLLPRLARLRHHRATGTSWAVEIRKLIADFLRVPDDRPEDSKVRDPLLSAVNRLHTLDQLAGEQGQPPLLPISFIREFVVHHLESQENTAGDFLTGGVTISSLPPLRAVPFRIVYVVGLGEGLFPGSHATSAFDLRARERRPGDVMPPEANRYLFLEAILAARDKLYLLYDCRELQKDEELQPCSPLNQLRRHVEQHILGNTPFKTVNVPLRSHDSKYIEADANPTYTDVLVNYNEADRLLAIIDAQRSGALKLDDMFERAEVKNRLAQAKRNFDLPVGDSHKVGSGVRVSLSELRGFLNCPAEAAVKRHLGLRDSEEPEPVDDEPFYTDSPFDFQLVKEFVHRFTLRAVAESVEAALKDWRQRFAELHEEWRLRGRVPEDAFGTVDQARLMSMAQKRIEGGSGLAAFLKPLENAEFCGPVLLGENRTPIGPRTRFPALRLPLEELQHAQLSGVLPYVWRTADAVATLIITRSKKLAADHLSMPMLESALFFLAIKASSESHLWLGKRRFEIHVAGEEGVARYCYESDDISAEEAGKYLRSLVRDFLDPMGLDLLPFNLVSGDRLRPAYLLADGDLKLEQLRFDYADLLRELVAESLETPPEYAAWRPMKLMEIVQADVPAEAFELVRRRFRLLDRAPAKTRNHGRHEKKTES